MLSAHLPVFCTRLLLHCLFLHKLPGKGLSPQLSRPGLYPPSPTLLQPAPGWFDYNCIVVICCPCRFATLRKLLCSDSLWGGCEYDVFCAVLKWVGAESARECHLAELLGLIRFPTMTLDQLTAVGKEPRVVACPGFKVCTHVVSEQQEQVSGARMSPHGACSGFKLGHVKSSCAGLQYSLASGP